MFKSKSLLTGVQSSSKSIINPVNSNSEQDLQLSTEMVKTLQQIETYYVEKMALRKYMEIPDSLSAYMMLNDIMVAAISKQRHSNLRLLFKIARDGMDGAYNSKYLFTRNAELDIRVLMLNKKIEEILSGKNDVKTMSHACGQLKMSKTFKLAPVYSYYIYLYGMPAYGVGFDVNKISLLVTILKKNGINPFK
jgi:hypothetical protein